MAKKAVLDKPTITKKATAKTTKLTTAKTTKAVPKKRSVSSDDDSDGGTRSTPPEAKKQKKAPVPRKAVSKAKPSQSKENESELDGDDSADAPKADGRQNSGDAYQKVWIELIFNPFVVIRYTNSALCSLLN